MMLQAFWKHLAFLLYKTTTCAQYMPYTSKTLTAKQYNLDTKL